MGLGRRSRQVAKFTGSIVWFATMIFPHLAFLPLFIFGTAWVSGVQNQVDITRLLAASFGALVGVASLCFSLSRSLGQGIPTEEKPIIVYSGILLSLGALMVLGVATIRFVTEKTPGIISDLFQPVCGLTFGVAIGSAWVGTALLCYSLWRLYESFPSWGLEESLPAGNSTRDSEADQPET